MFPFIKLFGYLAATKIVLCIYLVLFPISIMVFLKTFRPQQWYFAILSFTLMYNYFFDFGFLPFCLGIPLVFLTIVAFRTALEDSAPPWKLVIGCTFASLVFLSHPVNTIALAISVLMLVRFDSKIVEARTSGKHKLVSQIRKCIIMLFPIGALSAIYLAYLVFNNSGFHSPRKMFEYWSLSHQVTGIVRPLFSVNHSMDLAVIVVLVSLAFVLFFKGMLKIHRGFPLFLSIALIVFGAVLPRGAFLGGNDLSSRFVLFGIIVFLGSLKATRALVKYVTTAIVVLLFVINMASRTNLYSDISCLTEDYVRATVGNIPDNQRIYTVYSAFPEISPPPMFHAIAYYHIERGGYSPFVFTDQRHVAGIGSSINLPTSIMNWNWDCRDTVGLENALKSYGYLVVMTARSTLPLFFERYADKVVFRDSVCSIFKLKKDDNSESRE